MKQKTNTGNSAIGCAVTSVSLSVILAIVGVMALFTIDWSKTTGIIMAIFITLVGTLMLIVSILWVKKINDAVKSD
jgi:uncharacterized membrane-anchored protein